MGARKLESRLTARLLALAGSVIVAVGVASVLVAHHMLDAADTEAASARAKGSLDALETELAEGDTFAVATQEVVEAAEREGARVALRRAGLVAGDAQLGALAADGCSTIQLERDQGGPWRACTARDAEASAVAAIPIRAHRAAVTALWRGMAVVVVVALAAMALAIRRALRRPIAELQALVDWTTHIVDDGQPRKPPPSETSEIAQLEAAFDALVRRLLEALARERAASAHMAHELRTPLTALVAELESLKLDDDVSRAAVARIREDVARFADVIEAILVLSAQPRARGEAEHLVNVADLARDLAPPGVEVDAPDEALVDADDRLVRLALRNLLDNARKYAGGARVIRVSREGGAVRLTVADQGPGVSGAARERMFDRYWRGAADGEGRGLGLALVRAVAERHGGEARAEDAEEGAGLRVFFTVGPLVEWHEVAS